MLNDETIGDRMRNQLGDYGAYLERKGVRYEDDPLSVNRKMPLWRPRGLWSASFQSASSLLNVR